MPASPLCPLLFGLALAGCAAAPVPAPSQAPGFYAALASEDAQVDPLAARDLISIYRHNNGRAPLTIDPALQAAALAKARAMAAAGRAEGSAGGEPKRGFAVSNVSAGYRTLAEAFSGWRQSPTHNAHMLDPRARRIGIATAYAPGSKYKVFWALVLTD